MCFIPTAKNKVKGLKDITVVPLYPRFHFLPFQLSVVDYSPKTVNRKFEKETIHKF